MASGNCANVLEGSEGQFHDSIKLKMALTFWNQTVVSVNQSFVLVGEQLDVRVSLPTFMDAMARLWYGHLSSSHYQ